MDTPARKFHWWCDATPFPTRRSAMNCVASTETSSTTGRTSTCSAASRSSLVRRDSVRTICQRPPFPYFDGKKRITFFSSEKFNFQFLNFFCEWIFLGSASFGRKTFCQQAEGIWRDHLSTNWPLAKCYGRNCLKQTTCWESPLSKLSFG